ncbi:hypothetical protein GCM10017559_05990 [Streptosporangium longisporum]|uniref:3-keto-5-aminohexanoate cleavage protein n=1 Tax=Streptosporangium longisporum TaxID=46187 RepID=A0ABN3XQX3_9ACTN
MKKIIIEVRPNENTMRHENPNVPWTPREIAQDAAECREAGAALIHVHGRTPSGAPDSRPETHAEIVAGIRERCDLLVAPPLPGAAGASPDERPAGAGGAAGDPRTRPDFLVVDMGCANMDLYDPVSRSYASDGRSLANDVTTIGRLLGDGARAGDGPVPDDVQRELDADHRRVPSHGGGRPAGAGRDRPRGARLHGGAPGDPGGSARAAGLPARRVRVDGLHVPR